MLFDALLFTNDFYELLLGMTLSLHVSGSTAMPAIWTHLCNSDVTVLIASWVEYLSGWDFGDNVLQLVMKAFLLSLKSAHLRCIHGQKGVNCLIDDQHEENLVGCVLHFNDFVCPSLWQEYARYSKIQCLHTDEKPELTVLALKNVDLAGCTATCITMFMNIDEQCV